MLARLALCVFLVLTQTTCSGATPPMGPRRQPVTRDTSKASLEDRVFRPDQLLKENLARDHAARRPGYVRMPVSRKSFNGTGKWEYGWHWDGAPGEPRGKRGGRGGRAGGDGGGGGYGGQTPPSNASRDSEARKGPPIISEGSIPGSPYKPTPPVWATREPPPRPRPTRGGNPPPPRVSSKQNPPEPESSAIIPDELPQPSSTVVNRGEILTATRTTSSLERRQTNTWGYKWGWAHLLDIGGIAYSIVLEIGTPPQKVMVFIDTGSYELWVNPRCNTSASEVICNNHGQYYPNKSNSSTFIRNGFSVRYGTGAAVGSYWTDSINIAMFILPQVQFAVASDSEYTFAGILGLGYTSPTSMPYPNILGLLTSYNLISAPIFSIGLGSDGDEFCEIIFGGVNRWKFAGYLEPVPIWPPISQQDPKWLQYWVNVTSVGMTKDGEKPFIWTRRETFNMPVLIDTGSTLSYIRSDIVAAIAQQFNAMPNDAGNYIVDCSWREKKGTVDFGFNRGKMVINISYRDFIFEYIKGYCFLGVQPADVGSTNYVLGDTFVRAAYLVFDQQSDVVWMSQYYNCGDAVVPVGQTPMDIQYIPGGC